MNVLRLISEAKHSYAVLLGVLGDTDTVCNRLLLKWPDIVGSILDFLEGRDNRFMEDVSVLICRPIAILVEAYADRYRKSEAIIFKERVDLIMKKAHKDPVYYKMLLFRMANEAIEGTDISPHLTYEGKMP
jgi:hypothetical protein